MIAEVISATKMNKVLGWVLALLVAFAAAGCQRAGEAELKKGSDAEAKGDFAEAKRWYAEAIALGNGEGCQRVAQLLFQHDARELLAASQRDGQWVAKISGVTAQIRHFAKEASARGYPDERILDALNGSEEFIRSARTVLQKADEETRRAKTSGREDNEAGEALREAREQKGRIESDLVRIRKEVEELKQQVAASEKEAKETRETAAKDVAELEKMVNNEQATVFALAAMHGGDQYALQDAAFKFGAEAGVRTSWHKNVDPAKDKALGGRTERWRARLAARERELEDWEQMKIDCEEEIKRLQAAEGAGARED